MHIISYNVLAQAYLLPERYLGIPPEHLEAQGRQARLLAHIQGMGAQLLCLQEVEPALFRLLEEALPERRGIYTPKRGRPDGLATFYDPRLTLTHSQALHFTHADPGYDHIAQVLRFETPEGPLRLGNTHLRWQRNDTPLHRHQGVLQLGELLDSLDALPPGPRVVCGDLNVNAGSPVLRAARTRGLAPPPHDGRPADTALINGRFRRLDWVLHEHRALHSRERPLPSLRALGPIPGMREPSDHLPLHADLQSR